MPWTANLDSVKEANGNVVATVTFTDGTKRVTETLRGDSLDEPTLADWCAKRIACYESCTLSVSRLTPGPVRARFRTDGTPPR